MAPRGIGRQLVLQRPIQNGRVALSSTLKILSERAAGDLREGRTERLTSESFAVIRVTKIPHQLHGFASAASWRLPSVMQPNLGCRHIFLNLYVRSVKQVFSPVDFEIIIIVAMRNVRERILA